MKSMLLHVMADGGPVYKETNISRFIVEPWNAFSSLAYLLPVFYLLWKLRGTYLKNKFVIFFCAPLLFVGAIGSTLYHAFRVSAWLMYLDVLPIAILTFGVSVYFFSKIISRWWWIALIVILSLVLRHFVFVFLPMQPAINVSYIVTGALIFVPALWYVFKSKFFAVKWLLLATTFFSIALFFRYFDDFTKWSESVGTHWLWHVFGAAGAFYLGGYLIKITNHKIT